MLAACQQPAQRAVNLSLGGGVRNLRAGGGTAAL